MAALGLWLWSNPHLFRSANSCATEFASIAVLNVHARLGSHGLRGVSISLYTLFLAPGFNLILPMLLFLSFFIIQGTPNYDETQPSSIRRAVPALVRIYYPFALPT
jgi:hypothetical protein